MNYKSFLTLLITSVIASSAQIAPTTARAWDHTPSVAECTQIMENQERENYQFCFELFFVGQSHRPEYDPPSWQLERCVRSQRQAVRMHFEGS